MQYDTRQICTCSNRTHAPGQRILCLIVAYRTAAAEALEAGEYAERLVEKELKLTFGYEHMNMVMRMVKDLQPRIVSQDYKDNGDIVMTIAIRLSLVERVHSAFIVNGQSLVKVEEC